jgi:hypothetical protein
MNHLLDIQAVNYMLAKFLEISYIDAILELKL